MHATRISLPFLLMFVELLPYGCSHRLDCMSHPSLNLSNIVVLLHLPLHPICCRYAAAGARLHSKLVRAAHVQPAAQDLRRSRIS
jgi:hypothetical protein